MNPEEQKKLAEMRDALGVAKSNSEAKLSAAKETMAAAKNVAKTKAAKKVAVSGMGKSSKTPGTATNPKMAEKLPIKKPFMR